MSKSEAERFRSPNETFFAKTDADKKGTYTKNSSSNNSITGRLNLTFGRSFGDHTVNGVAGMQFSDKNQSLMVLELKGILRSVFQSEFFFQLCNRKTQCFDSKSRSVSYYFNANYAYNMRYLIDFNLTTNGASQFGINDPFTTTWAVGVGWNVHNERFFVIIK